MVYSASTTAIAAKECPIDMDIPTYLSPGMVSIQPLTFNKPRLLNSDSDLPLEVPVSVEPSITVTFSDNPDTPEGTPFDKVVFPSPSNVQTVKIYKMSPTDQEWVQLTAPGGSPAFDATEPILFDEPIAVSLLKFVPQTTNENDDDFKIKLQVHACVPESSSTTATPTTALGIYTFRRFIDAM